MKYQGMYLPLYFLISFRFIGDTGNPFALYCNGVGCVDGTSLMYCEYYSLHYKVQPVDNTQQEPFFIKVVVRRQTYQIYIILLSVETDLVPSQRTKSPPTSTTCSSFFHSDKIGDGCTAANRSEQNL